MWSQSRGLGCLETVSRSNNVSSRTTCSTSRLGLGPIRLGPCLGLGPKCLGISSRSRTNTSWALSRSWPKMSRRLVSVSDQYVSGLVSVLAQNVSASRLGLGLFHVVGRDVLCGVRRSIVVVVPYRPICLSP